MKKVVVACDSFKGSITSAEVARAACEGIRDACPGIEAIGLAVADGGEGTAVAVTKSMDGEWVNVVVNDPLRRKIPSGYGIVNVGGVPTAVIDMASASGLTLLDSTERNPLLTTTYGTGQLMLDAYRAGCRSFMIGIGGSATNDAGKGMLEALSVRFLDDDGRELPDGGASLSRLASIDLSTARVDILGADITVMCDVDNPLCGPNGASAVYAPQKGATPEMVSQLDAALSRFAQVVKAVIGRDVADIPGAGAAGGLGAAFLAFTNARLRRGVDTLLDLIGFDKIIADADLVITGEGRLDRQTLNGKLPMGVIIRCLPLGIPVIAIAGSIADRALLSTAGFTDIHTINPPDLPLADAMRPSVAYTNIRRTVAQIISQ